MVTEAIIQSHVNHGYSIAASKVGHTFVVFRPLDTGPVLRNQNIVQELPLAFDQDYHFGFMKPSEYNKQNYYALLDLTLIKVGDYLWDYDQHIFFVAWIEPLRPAELTRCDATINLIQPSGSIDNGYGGDTTPVTKITGWPIAISPGTKGETNEAHTPGSVRSPWMIGYAPLLPDGVMIEEYDVIIDELGRRYVVSMPSLGKEGWYFSMAMEQP
jgi:hypothetical protein